MSQINRFLYLCLMIGLFPSCKGKNKPITKYKGKAMMYINPCRLLKQHEVNELMGKKLEKGQYILHRKMTLGICLWMKGESHKDNIKLELRENSFFGRHYDEIKGALNGGGIEDLVNMKLGRGGYYYYKVKRVKGEKDDGTEFITTSMVYQATVFYAGTVVAKLSVKNKHFKDLKMDKALLKYSKLVAKRLSAE